MRLLGGGARRATSHGTALRERQQAPERGAWYRDPFGLAEERWWDGKKWTREVRGATSEHPAASDREPTRHPPSDDAPADASPPETPDQRESSDFPVRIETASAQQLRVLPSEHQPCMCREVLTAGGRAGAIRLFGAQQARLACADGVWFLKRSHGWRPGFRIESANRREVGWYSPLRRLLGGTISLVDGMEVELRRSFLRGWKLCPPDKNQGLAVVHTSGVWSAQTLTVTIRSLPADASQGSLIILASCAVLMLPGGVA